MEYILKRSNRKTISIRVTKNATLEVRAPKRMPIRSIEHFLESKDEWIQEHIDIALKKNNARDAFSLDYWGTIHIRGMLCEIVPTNDKFPFGPIKENDSYRIFVPDNMPPEQILEKVRKLLIEYAKAFIPTRTSELAKLLEVSPSSVRVGKANTRWGSCSSQGRINFSWKIIMCDDAVIDYVIIHELCHLLQMNHSQKFWNEVHRYSPNYKEHRRMLKKFSNTLDSEDW